MSFGSEIARETKTQGTVPATVLNLNKQHRPRSIYRLHRFCRARTSEDYRSSYDADKDYWKKCQIYRSKYIQESLINTSLQLYITLYNISLRLLRSVNTLNSKLKFKTILINKSQLLLKALYLEATLTFLRFAAKHCSIAQLFGGSYQLYGGISCLFQTLLI